MRAVFAALAIVGLMAIAGPTVTVAAATPSAGAAASPAVPADAGEIGPLSAYGCTGRNGPGQLNSTCIDVTGTGTLVQKIRGSMQATKPFPPRPTTLCGVVVHVWGTLQGGARYDRSGTAACSYVGYAYVDWSPFTQFAPNSSLCARTYWDNEWSNPACVTIR